MSTETVPAPPPFEVIAEFLGNLQNVCNPYDRLTPVLRGSTLMRHWFGSRARPAADLDLEWFPDASWTAGRYATPIVHARCLCMLAVLDSDDSVQPVFDPDLPVPSDGTNLWDYATPGLRLYSGWYWTDRNLGGCLQIDVAQPGLVDLDSITTNFVKLPRPTEGTARIRAYTPEMLLASKLSWIIRDTHFDATESKVNFVGQPKDLFDAYLLVTEGKLRGNVFNQSLMAVVFEDRLSWQQVEMFMDQDNQRLLDTNFTHGRAFTEQHSPLMTANLAEMLVVVVQRCAELWQDYRQPIAFFHMTETQRDETSMLVYADYLEECMDPRSDFLRLCCRFLFHDERSLRSELQNQMKRYSLAWLCHALGSIETVDKIR